MQLHECPHRRLTAENAAGAGRIVCGLADQILGFDTDDRFPVQELTCGYCGRLALPTAAAPNAVVASVVYDMATQILEDGRTPDREFGRAFQARCYVFPALAEADMPNQSIGNSIPVAADWQRASRTATALPRRRAQVGLVGYNTASGLGYLTRDLAIQHVADRWLVVPHPRFPAIDLPATGCRIELAQAAESEQNLTRWLDGLDWVLFAELSYIEALPRLARQAGVQVALIPMWESLSPFAEWLRFVDLMICPTRHSYEMFLEWKVRFGFTWKVQHLAWPVATDRFHFRQREKCERFVFINGTGGVPARRLDGAVTAVRRKGLDVILEVAQLAPDIPWIVYSQTDDSPCWPENVVVLPPPDNNADLYNEGDVCVQPSRWEGLGLQLLECQAAGLPLVTTDAAPMNEHQPLRLLRPCQWEWGYIHAGQPVQLPVFDAVSVAKVVRELFGTDLTAASAASREFVERHHSWDQAATALRQIFDSQTTQAAAKLSSTPEFTVAPSTPTVETCRYRTSVSAPPGGEESAACELLRQVLQSAAGVACRVARTECDACCRSFRPSPAVWNPIIASLVYSRAHDDSNALSVESARALRDRAEQFLEIDAQSVLPHEQSAKLPARQAAASLREILPVPRLKSGSLVQQWAVGVTTAPRRHATLEKCLDFLSRAGWPRPVLLSDGRVAVPELFQSSPGTCRDEPLGAWPHYYLSLTELLMREPLADAYMLVQDDALFFDGENVREYLEESLWPGTTPGIVSLYWATPNPESRAGWSRCVGNWKSGALAFVFPRPVAIELLLDQTVLAHRWSDDREGLVGIPGVIEDWAVRRSVPLYYPTPSLVQHIGATSAIWRGSYELTAARRASFFAGDVIRGPNGGNGE